jgi:hypothetical protein
MAGGETSDTKVTTRLYDQSFGRSGAMTSQMNAEKMKT